VKESFRLNLQTLLTEAENHFAETESEDKEEAEPSSLTAMEITVLEQRAYAALGKRDGIGACLWRGMNFQTPLNNENPNQETCPA